MVEDDWKPVGEAAESCGVPVRTAYNWLKSRRVESKVVGGVTMVPASSFRAWADRRATGANATSPEPPVPGPRAGTIAGTEASNAASTARTTHRGSPLDGATAAQLFAAFERGETPSSIVQTLEVPPQEALSAWRQWDELRGIAAHKPDFEARLDDLAQSVAGLALKVDEYTAQGRIVGDVHVLRRALDELKRTVEFLPAPRSEEFTCACGRHGQLAFRVHCMACNAEYVAQHFPRSQP